MVWACPMQTKIDFFDARLIFVGFLISRYINNYYLFICIKHFGIEKYKKSLNPEIDSVTCVTEVSVFSLMELQEIKTQIAHARHQISMIKICSTSEKAKREAHVRNMENHGKGFQVIFDKERTQQECRMKELHDKEEAEEEQLRQKERELADRNEQQAREAAAIEAECEAVEQECAVLKKRNNAIMLKLRRKLLETENARRELMKKNTAPEENTE